MTDELLQDQEELLRQVLQVPASSSVPEFHDDLYARVAHLCWSGDGSDLDLAVLVRHLLRRWSLRDKRNVRVAVEPSVSVRLRRAAAATALRESPRGSWSAVPWKPHWLDSTGEPDAAAGAGTAEGRRFQADDLAADPFFERCTGFDHYRTPGQRAACRAVVSAPAGSTIVAMLPTGSGKTEVALCLADQVKNAVTLIIVPTVALAYDFERRFQDHYARRIPRADKASLRFAWTASTSEDVRERLRNLVKEGRQPLLVTSPESMTRTLRALLMEVADTGRLGGLVVDEAHLVTQWGRDFRPEFRTVADLRADLLRRSEEVGHPNPKTLLLSATLGSHELQDLHRLFGNPGPCTLIAANALRPEPDLWIAEADNELKRRQWVTEALARLPRPAILYVTSPKEAEEWVPRLQQVGYHRLAMVTGRTTTDERSRTLQALRCTAESPAAVDLVVATSAFGLGIDYAHVRTVVHACLPETIDRWYQELGRGGRDGDTSAAFLLTAPTDRREAENLSTTVLTDDTARKRWTDLWHHRKTYRNKEFVDLEASRGSVAQGSYNRRWNAQLIQGLVELGALRRHQVDVEDLSELSDEAGLGHDWTSIELQHGDLRSEAFWSSHWSPWQQQEVSRSRRALDAVIALSDGTSQACRAIAQSYRPNEATYDLFGPATDGVEPLVPCGRCPGCRRDGYKAPDDPPPRPTQKWPLADDLTTRLEDLADAAAAQDRLVLLVADHPHEVAPLLGSALARRGVRHFAGPVGEAIRDHSSWLFVDTLPVAPTGLTPCSSFVVYPAASHIPAAWLSPRARMVPRQQAPPAFDVLLASRDATLGGRRLGRDLLALDAITALQILGD
ncbi:protein DpdF [Streptomyces sp. NBC_00838]|uniref:protein DpdF n=1 Tax=Streptomyces sp. NBC_00838 TaxID=2903680 RepID=UPI00386E0E0A|nr:protein DpdF [Streptomyces sp. NBC_00838]